MRNRARQGLDSGLSLISRPGARPRGLRRRIVCYDPRMKGTAAGSWSPCGCCVLGWRRLPASRSTTCLRQRPRSGARRRLLAWAFLAAGLVAWSRRPGNRLGPLMVASCFALLLRQLRYSHDALAFTVFFAARRARLRARSRTSRSRIPPGGSPTGSSARFLKVVVRGRARLPARDPARLRRRARGSATSTRSRARACCSSPGRRRGSSASSRTSYAVIAYGVLAALFIVLVAPEARARDAAGAADPRAVARRRRRRRAVGRLQQRRHVHRRAPPAFVDDNVFWWQIVGLIALPLALLVGLLRSRLAHVDVGELVVQLEQTPAAARSATRSPGARRPDARGRLLAARAGEYVDADGGLSTLPEDGHDRAVTWLEHDGEPLAASIHDPSLRDEPELVEAAGAAARLALENARLQAELQAQLEKVQGVARADRRRRRRAAPPDRARPARRRAAAAGRARARAEARPAAARRSRRPGGRAPARVDCRRAAGRGRGAARARAGHSPGDPHAGRPRGRSRRARRPRAGPGDRRREPRSASRPRSRRPPTSSPPRRSTNVAKHAHASRVDPRRAREREARDRGRGRRRRRRGGGRRHGLRGLADRVEAQGGRLRIESPRRRRHSYARGDPVRVVIAEDSVLLREGLARILAEGGFEVVASVRANADELHDGRPKASTERRGRRRRMPPDPHRRGSARRARDPRAVPGDRRPAPLPGGRGDARARTLQRAAGGLRLPAQGPRPRDRRLPRGGPARGPRRHRDRSRGDRPAPRADRGRTTRSSS